MPDNSKTPSSNSTSDMAVPDFFDALICEASEGNRKMARLAEDMARVMTGFAENLTQQAALNGKLIDAARQYRGEQGKLAKALEGLAAGNKTISDVRGTDRAFGESVVTSAAKAWEEAAGSPAEPFKLQPTKPEPNSVRDQILDRYTATGDDHQTMAYDHGLIPATVNQWLKDAREQGDPRVASGDLRRMERDHEEEANLRAEFRLEGTRHTGIIFPDDDQIGKNLAVLKPATGDVRTEWGHTVVPPYWIDALACLNDQREVPGKELIEAGKFPSERALLRELRTVNERLAEAKLYILADSAHYQLCRLL